MSKTLWVGFSGGVDSRVLLEITVQDNKNNNVGAIHVNHNLHPNSSKWQDHCQDICDNLNIKLEIINVEVDGRKIGVEAAARDARFVAFAGLVGINDTLLLAHHKQDQAETVLLRLLRGTGVKGLAGMKPITKINNMTVVRPLLNVSKQEIIDFATKNNLTWLEDPSNMENKFDRNYIRNNIMPAIVKRWPQGVDSIARAATHCQDINIFLENEVKKLYDDSNDVLNIEKLLQLNNIMQKMLIRYWLGKLNCKMPSAKLLRVIIDDVVLAKNDAEPLVKIADFSVRRFQGNLYLVRDDSLTEYSRMTPPEGCIIGFRCGGERYKPEGAKFSKSLKKVMQEMAIPPWERARVPLVLRDGVVVELIYLTKGSTDQKEYPTPTSSR